MEQDHKNFITFVPILFPLPVQQLGKDFIQYEVYFQKKF